MTIDVPYPDPDRLKYRRSFLVTRLVIGTIGLILPVALPIGAWLIFREPLIQDSLSGYYYSGMRDWFVGSMWAIGAGLICYAAARANQDTVVSNVAGILAIVIALFPTNPAGTRGSLTSAIHLWSAALFLILLGVICWLYGKRDRRRPDRSVRQQKTWGRLHKICAVCIWLAVAAVAMSKISDVLGSRITLVAEIVAVVAFGLSWSVKGAELFSVLLGRSGRYLVAAGSAKGEVAHA
jgi:uncharacterized membrane protein YidH (DUF202 family)